MNNAFLCLEFVAQKRSIISIGCEQKPLKPLFRSLSSLSFRADVMALCLRASSRTSPYIITRCFATKDIIRGKTPLRCAPLKKKSFSNRCIELLIAQGFGAQSAVSFHYDG